MNMYEVKPLHLANALSFTLPDQETAGFFRNEKLRTFLDDIESTIKEYDAQPVGPLILKSSLEYKEDDDVIGIDTYIQQADRFVEGVKPPYRMDKTVNIAECLWFHYSGEKMRLLERFFDVRLQAIEKEISLANEIYVFFSSQSSDDDCISVEVFIPICNGNC